MSIKVSWDQRLEGVAIHRHITHLAGLPPRTIIFPPFIFFPALLHPRNQAPAARFCANYILLPHK